MFGNEDVLVALGRIEGKLEEISTLPKRVRTLEAWRSFLAGGMALLVLIVGWVLLLAPLLRKQ